LVPLDDRAEDNRACLPADVRASERSEGCGLEEIAWQVQQRDGESQE